jgi:hypothetical protein
MIDVRLTATNPEDSTLVPVPCNVRGELLTVAPVIESIPNDVEIQGDLTVTGLINGSIGVGEQGPEGPEGPAGPPGPPGADMLPPNPENGDVLGYINDEIAWVSGVIPEPVVRPLTWSNADSFKLVDDAGAEYSGVDKLDQAETYDYWNTTTTTEPRGFQIASGLSNRPQGEWSWADEMTFESPGLFGEVFKIYLSVAFTRIRTNNSLYYFQSEIDDQNITVVSEGFGGYMPLGEGNQRFAISQTCSYISARPISGFTYRCGFDFYDCKDISIYVHGIEVVDAGRFAVMRQAEISNELKAFRNAVAQLDIRNS